MVKHQRPTLLLRVRPALLGLLVCALANLAPAYVSGHAPIPPAAGHQLQGDFLRYWQQNDGARRLGQPLSAAIWLDGRLTQMFARSLLEQRAGQSAGIDRVALPNGWQQQT
ncbi:MAG: hypothetical protein ABI901_17915, partial [Roseiflexaceae bacterium]